MCGQNLQTQRCFCARMCWQRAAALERVFHMQRWHWKAGFSSGTAALLLWVYFWCLLQGCLLPALAFFESLTSLGVFPFLV